MASMQSDGEDPSKVDFLKEALYDAVKDASNEARLWSQKDLMKLDILPKDNIALLLNVVNKLCSEMLFKPVTDGRLGLCWKWRGEDDAKKYRMLTSEQRLVYELIDDAGADGIWNRNLRTRIKLHESVLKQCVKHLETKGYIRDMKSVENPTKKMYIKASLQPSDRATGGAWYTDSKLDEAFIEQLQTIIFDFVRRSSTYESKHGGGAQERRQPKKGVLKGSDTTRGKKRAAEAISVDDDPPSDRVPQKKPHNAVLLPLPAGYTAYPTVREIAKFIEKSGVTNNTILSESEVRQLVDVLAYDGVLEAVSIPSRNETGYRVTNIARLDPNALTKQFLSQQPGMEKQVEFGAPPMSNGLTEAPCGQCPVFDLCEVGGPVNPGNCEYFKAWLEKV